MQYTYSLHDDDEYGNGRMIEKLYMLKFHHCTMDYRLLLWVVFLMWYTDRSMSIYGQSLTPPHCRRHPSRHGYHIYVYCNGKRLFQLLIHIHTGPQFCSYHHSPPRHFCSPPNNNWQERFKMFHCCNWLLFFVF